MNKLDLLNAIIIEDNSCQAELLKQVIKKYCPKVKVKSVAQCMGQANKVLKETEYDIIFLDVNLGSDCAFKLLETCASYIQDKELIVISADKEHALEAFSYAAIDYILKPIAPEGVIKAVNKARTNIDLKRSFSRSNEKPIPTEPLKILAIPSLSEVKIIKVDDILYLQSEGRYTIFYTINGEKIVSSKNLGTYEELLRNNNFFRNHHSYLVNVNFISNVQKKDGVYLKILDKKYLPVSTRRIEPFYQYLRIK